MDDTSGEDQLAALDMIENKTNDTHGLFAAILAAAFWEGWLKSFLHSSVQRKQKKDNARAIAAAFLRSLADDHPDRDSAVYL